MNLDLSLFAELERVRQRIAAIEEARIPASQKHWALDDAWRDLDAIYEELNALDDEENEAC